MASREKVEVVLDVTVSPEAWNLAHGKEPVADLPEYVTEQVRYAPRARLTASPGPLADVILAGAEVTSETADWVTMQIVLDVRLDGEAWLARWGVSAEVSVGAHLAAFLATLPTMTEDATVVCAKSSRVLAEYRCRRPD